MLHVICAMTMTQEGDGDDRLRGQIFETKVMEVTRVRTKYGSNASEGAEPATDEMLNVMELSQDELSESGSTQS